MSVDYATAVRLIRKGRRAEQRSATAKGCVGALITSVLGTLLKGYLFMLAVGIAHAHWWHNIPTIGFWWSLLLMAVLPSLGGSASTKDKT